MKKLLVLIQMILLGFGLNAQEANPGDAILGTYASEQSGHEYHAKITKKADGTYKAQVIWVKDAVDPATGEKLKDTKNPNKSLRDVPVDEVVLMDGLKYNADKNQWGDTKIYDPDRGIRANVVVRIEPDGKVSLKGSVLGISETVYWTRL